MKFCPHTLLSLLRQCGFEFGREPDQPESFWVSPSSKITPEMREAIHRHKRDLLAALPGRQS